MSGRDSMADRATRPPHPNMAETTAHREGGHGPDRGAHTTDTKLTSEKHEHILTTQCPNSQHLHTDTVQIQHEVEELRKTWTGWLLVAINSEKKCNASGTVDSMDLYLYFSILIAILDFTN